MIRVVRLPVSIIAIVMMACALTSAATLRVMSFNIRGDFDLEQASNSPEAWNSLSHIHRRDLVIKTIQDFAPDILGVQEAFWHQLVDLEKGLRNYAFYGVGRDDGKKAGEHSAILYRLKRFDRQQDGSFWLSHTPSVAGSKHPDAANIRIASWVVLADRGSNGTELFVLNTHWDHVSEAARLHAAHLIRSQLPVLAGGRPSIVIGDMNAGEGEAATGTLLGRGKSSGLRLIDSYRAVRPEKGRNEATHHSFSGDPAGSRIDYILCTAEFRVADATIVRTKFDTRYPSDHFPVTATLELADEASASFSPTAPR